MNETTQKHSFEGESTKVNIAISATFVAEPIEASLSAWMAALGINAKITFAPFNQIFQQLLDPLSRLSKNHDGINVILLRFSDWHNYGEGSDATLEAAKSLNGDVTSHIDELVTALSVATRRCPATFLVVVCPEHPSDGAGSSAEEHLNLATELEDVLVTKTQAVQGVHIVTRAELDNIYPVADPFDPSADKMATIPYSPIFYTALGSMVARKTHNFLSPPYKVVLLDCDGTLWDGTCGEDGPRGIRIDSGRRALQEFIVNQSRQGMLICLCSKNNESDVFSVFDERSDMALKREHFTAWRINWRNKSDNILSLSHELGLSLDSFIFIDNDPVECAEVRESCPEILTLLLPNDPESIPVFLRHVWPFDHDRVSQEDKKRTALYREHFVRESLRRESPTLKEFISKLNLEITIEPLLEKDIARVSEITFRTNQFNLTSTRRSVPQLKEFCRVDNAECFTVHVKDRFGDYGLVGAVFCKTHDGNLLIDNILLSCRALGRGVEHHILASLGEIALQRGLSYIDLCYKPSNKNAPALNFLGGLSSATQRTFEDGQIYRMDAREAAKLVYDPDAEHNLITQDGKIETGPAPSRPDSVQRATLLCSIAESLCDPALIHSWVTRSQSRNVSDGEYVKPVTPAEICIAKMFSELLGIDQVGVNAGFFQLGGHSLLAMQLLSRINVEFGVSIEPITLFTTNMTVAELAVTVLSGQLSQRNPQDVDTILNALSAITDDDVL